ncbi:MAG: DMT family transporter [Peptostreptococcaceae bacterium]|nr:DMT family transporter [Peptostreptococcaceae bacterium]
MSNSKKGLIAAILSAVLFGFMPITTKYLYSFGCSTVTVVFFRQILVLPIVLVLFIKSKKVKLSKKDMFEALKIIIMGMLFTQTLLYASYRYISTGLATTLHFSYPVFAVLGMLIFYKSKLTWVKALCVVLCTSGIFMFYEHTEGLALKGMLIALLSGLCYAYYIIRLGKSNLRFMPPMQYAVLFITVNSVVLFTYGTATKSLQWDFPLKFWIVIFLFAIAITLFAVLLVQYAVKYIEPDTVSILSTLEPITSIIVGILWLNEGVTVKTGLGMMLILAAVVIITLYNKETKEG